MVVAIVPGVDDQRARRALRGLRQRRRWRQADLAQQAQISQSTESLIERGHLDHLTLGTIRRAFATCDASVSLDVRWRGGELDRMLDAKHAELVAAVGRYLDEHGWNATFEVTYSHYGERGSIDVVAIRGDAVLVVEVKSELTSIEETLRKLDEKARRARQIVFERTGRRPLIVGRLLVLPDTTASRGRVLGHAAILGRALPGRAVALRDWLRSPTDAFSGILFVRNTSTGDGARRVTGPRKRIQANPARPTTGAGRTGEPGRLPRTTTS